MSKKLLFSVVLIVFVFGMLVGCTPAASPIASEPPAEAKPEAAAPVEPEASPVPTVRAATPGRLILATTTSTQDSGLLDVILPDFRQKFNIEVDVIAVGTGQALQLGKDGNADVLLVHARAQEDAFMESGDGIRREDVMYNDFVILGPQSDPAGIKGMSSAAGALKQIADSGATFISRGDKSGTHSKELSIWKSAEIEPSGGWYLSAGQGMGEVLTMANEQQAYTLSDRATYLARTKMGIDLVVVVEKDKTLLNPYGVIVVNPSKGTQINAELAHQFTDWIISLPVQEMIANYGKADFGESLFVPDSQIWREAQ
jgi:tungstate transport system substrate-binding protein